MIQNPQFKPHLHAERLPGEGVMLLSERGHALLRGRLYELVAPLIDGQRSADAIAQQLNGQIASAEVYYALGHLEKKGYLTARNGAVSKANHEFWHLQGLDPATAVQRLEEATVDITALGGVEFGPLSAALRSLKIHVVSDQSTWHKETTNDSIGVVVTDDYLRRGLDDYNHEALQSNRSWILVKPVGSQIWLGPVFRPGQTTCWECLASRLRANREVELFLQNQMGRPDPFPVPFADLPMTRAIAWNLAAIEIAKWITSGNSPDLEGRLLTVDTLSWKTQWHTVVRRPQCPACGNPNLARELAIVLQSRKKAFTREGGHRTVSPAETLRLYGHHISRLTGAVTSLERIGSQESEIHVYWSGHNRARQQSSFEEIRRGLRSRSAGKGATDLQAKASGLCEALERSSGLFRGDERRTKPCRLRDLGDAGIHPNLCMQFSDKQYREREAWNARKKSPVDQVPEPFDEEEAIEWTPVWSLTRNQARYLPTALCYYGYLATRGCCRACSNGNAAGNSLEEAILQGFFEVVERDAVALWWYNRIQRPGVDLDSFDEPYLRQLSQCLFGQQQRDLWALDLTTDLGVPAFAALSRRLDGKAEEILIGFGAHSDARIALLRAVTELNQMLSWVWIDKSGKPQQNLDDPETLAWLKTATLANQPYLAPADNPRRLSSDFVRCQNEDLRDDVLACQALVEQHGMELLVLNQTRPDIGLPVVKVIVPGLRHFWARFAPGRLYDVPVKLGWLPQPTCEGDLNPIPIFL